LNRVNTSIYSGIDPNSSSWPVTKATGWIAPDSVARSTYEAHLLQLINGPFPGVPARFDFVYNQIVNLVYVDPYKSSQGLTNPEFDSNLTAMKNWVPARISAIRSQLSPVVTAAATDASAAEPSNPGTFTVTRAGSTSGSLIVNFTIGGTAANGTDYASIGTSVTIPAGSASATVTVTPIDDTAVESNETVVLALSAGTGYTVGSPSSATVTIADDDAPPAGSGLSATYYDNADFTGASATRTDPAVDFDWGAGSPAAGIGSDTFSARWTGRVRASASEPHTFYTFTNDGVRLWVEGELLVDRWVLQSGGIEWSGQVALEAGRWYTVQMDYYENTGNAVARLLWSSPSTPKQAIPQNALDPAMGPPDPRDNDGDGIPNDSDPDDDNDGIPDLQDPDRDGDGAPNVAEASAGTDPDDGTSFPALPTGSGGGGGGGGCGTTGMEGLLLVALLSAIRGARARARTGRGF
jgi:hypothetical protein